MIMAKMEWTKYENFDALLNRITNGILRGSVSASLENSADFRGLDARCSIRVFERYSAFGKNRVSLSVTLFQDGNGPVQICGITSGGSQAIFLKINTIGEESFLEKLNKLLI